MGLFKADLFRSFVVGFALGAIGLAMTLGDGSGEHTGGMVSPAIAAPAEVGAEAGMATQ